MVFRRRRSKHDDVTVDRVTGVFNRRQLDRDIAAGSDLADQPTATLLVDVDDFGRHTRWNDSIPGKAVLERVSWVIMATVRTTDVVYRPGTSTFCVLLPATTDRDARVVADRIRVNVERMPLLAESKATVSIGVAAGASNEIARTIERADRALVAGAASGHNQVFGDPDADTVVPLETAPVDTLRRV